MTQGHESHWFTYYFPDYTNGMLDYGRPFGVDANILMRTEPIREWSSHVTGSLSPVARPCDMVSARQPWLIVSGRVASAVEEMSCGTMECLPVFLLRDTGEEISGYSVVHIMREIAAFDRDNGTYWVEAGKFGITGIALNRAATEGVSIPAFRLAEDPSRIVLSETLVHRLVEMKLSDAKWVRLEAF